MADEKKTLNARQQRFVNEYRIDRNATAAAIRAGYAPSNAKQTAYKLMQSPEIVRQIEEHRVAAETAFVEVLDEAKIDIRATLQEYMSIGFSNIMDFVDFDENGDLRVNFSGATRQHMAAVQEFTVEEKRVAGSKDGSTVVKTRFKLHPKLPALDRIAEFGGVHAAIGKNRTEKTVINHSSPTITDTAAMIAELEKSIRELEVLQMIEDAV